MERLADHYRLVLEKCRSEKILLDTVLLEKRGEETWTAGYTSNYLRVLISNQHEFQKNQLISVEPMELMVDSKAQDVALISKPILH
jgi:hypothetical protein